MTTTVAQALTRARTQSRYGPAFRVGLCKQKCRELYDVPSDGSPSAAVAWTRTRYRHQFHEQAPPIGALIWWTGGAGGYGHVAVYAGHGEVWSTDILRAGYFDQVPLTRIASSWPNLTLVGWSEDIDGVRVITAPTPPKEIDDMTDDELRALLEENNTKLLEGIRNLNIAAKDQPRLTLGGALRNVFHRTRARA